MKHDVFIGGLSSDTPEDDICAHLMDPQVKHIVSIAKLTTNVPRVAAFRVTIADDTIKHNVFNPINFQQGIRIMPFRYYENVKAPDLAPPALKQPTTTKPRNVTKPAKKMKPLVTKGKKDNKNPENSASKTTQGNHHKQNDSTLQQAQERPKEPDSSHTAPSVADTRTSYGPPQCYHSGPPMQMAYSMQPPSYQHQQPYYQTTWWKTPSGIDNSNPSQPFNYPHFPAPTPMNYRQF